MKKIKLSPSNKEIEVQEGETVLATLERCGFALPNNCRAGACGECKVKVVSGEYDQGFILDMALKKEEKEEGYGLMCMAKPTSETLEIEWDMEENKPKLFPPSENLPFMVIDKNQVSPKIVRLKLKSLGSPLRFWPGQYITLQDTNEKHPKRCYSLANTLNKEGEIILLISKLENGEMSTWIHKELNEGELVKVSGPYGTFVGDPNVDRPVLCLAHGSGLAPILSLATGALQRGGFTNPAHILFSAPTKNDLIELGKIRYLEKKHRNFKFKYTLTQDKSEGALEGRITDILQDHYKDLSDYSIYVAGSPEFVEDCKNKVLSLGADEKFIHSEGFVAQ